MKKLQESDEYRESASGFTKQSRASIEVASTEKRANQDKQKESGVDAGKSTSNLEQTISNRMEEESCITEENVLPDEEHRDTAKHPKPHGVIVIAAEVHPTEDETLPEQSSPSKKAKGSDQHSSNHQDHKQKLQKASAFDQDETATGESIPKSQDTKPDGSSIDKGELDDSIDTSTPSPNSINKIGDQSNKGMHEINESIDAKDEEISKPVQDDDAEIHRCDSSQHKNGTEEELRSSRHNITEAHAAVITDVKINAREESENAVQDSGPKDVQQEIQESKNDVANKEEKRKPVQNTDAVENDLQESKHDDASVTEQPKEESKHKDGGSAKEQPEPESKCNNEEPHKQESKRDDAQPDQESKHKAKEGKEVLTHDGAEMVNNSPEIMVLAADSDGGATKPESSSEGKAGNVHS